MKFTIIVWSDNRVVVRQFVGDDDDAAVMEAKFMLSQITDDKDSPCWQILDGFVPVDVVEAKP